MKIKLAIIFMLTLVILTGTPASLAKPEYLTSLNTVYGNGICDTCHVNGISDGPRTSYGTLFENQSNHTADPIAALRAIGAPPAANSTITPIATSTPAAPVSTATPEVTTITITATPTAAKATPASPGFGILASLVGLFAWALLAKRNN